MQSRKSSSGVIFTAIIVSFSLALMSLSIGQDHTIKLIREQINRFFAPPRYVFTRTGKKIYEGLHYFVIARKLAIENERLRQKIKKLQSENLLLKEEHAENKRLKRLLKLREQTEYKTIAASVIAWYPTYFSMSIVINRGYLDGIKRGMAVISCNGLVGKIDKVFSRSSTILLLTDRRFSIGAMTQSSRNEGVLSGGGNGYCYLEYLPSSADVKPGDIVITIGFDTLFPKGIIIGKTIKVKKETLFTTAVVKPVADLDKLEEVLIITGEKRRWY